MKVFLSSTAQDLVEYRKIADDTILRLSQQSIAMERFGPLPGMPVAECERLAAESDVVICIVAHRYGFIPEKDRGSITRREVEAAHNAKKTVLVWIVADDYPWSEPQEQDLLTKPEVIDNLEKVAEVTGAIRELIAFKAWLLTTFTPERFTTADDLGRKIAVALSTYLKGHTTLPIPQEKISISRLPTSGSELFGRETELQMLDEAWSNPNTNIVTLVAWGGVGKTAMVNHWLKRRMARDNYRSAERVYGWSFFSQGTKEGGGSADLFIDQVLRWFGDADPTSGSPWDKGERLAHYIRQTRTLLILDGLEPLQHPPGTQEGRLKDAALQALLVELAAQQPGLCLISTRVRVGDLVEFEGSTVVQHDLEHLSYQAGAEVLRSLGVKGDHQELEDAARELRGHAFSLTLLGSYLDEVLDGEIGRRKEVENLFTDTRYGDAAQRMIAAYEKWLGEGIELAMLRLLGLFDRPADLNSLIALRDPPVIVGLTEPLQQFKAREWNQAIAKLRRIRLLGEASIDDPRPLDAHPLVREYFKQQLKRDRGNAWRSANDRLYEHLKQVAKEFPDTVGEMSPLYAALYHGCEAGRHQQACYEVYLRRIQRGRKAFSLRQLGSFGADLAALAGFFETPWQQLRNGFDDPTKRFLLLQAGGCLSGVGRLQEAVEPMQAAVAMGIAANEYEGAATSAIALSTLYVSIGDLQKALHFAERCVELADLSNVMQRRVNNRAALGNVLHQTGRSFEALSLFGEAEELLKNSYPHYRTLFSIAAFWYCDLLIAEGETEKVRDMASFALAEAEDTGNLLSIALHNLVLGRVFLIEGQSSASHELSKAEHYLQLAVVGLRKAGMMDELPHGFLARAQLYRLMRKLDRAERDLSEVHRISVRSGMGLFLADYHLESARLDAMQESNDKAREHLVTAKEMITRMGYHRRDKEVQELEAQLA